MIGSGSYCSSYGLASRLLHFSARKMPMIANSNSPSYRPTEVSSGSDSGLCSSRQSNHHLQYCQSQWQTEQRLWGDASFKPSVKAHACNANTPNSEAEGFSQVWGHPVPQSEIPSRGSCGREVGWRGGRGERRRGGSHMRWGETKWGGWFIVTEIEVAVWSINAPIWKWHITLFTTNWIKLHNANSTIRKYKITLCQSKELELSNKQHRCMSYEAHSTLSPRILILPSEHAE